MTVYTVDSSPVTAKSPLPRIPGYRLTAQLYEGSHTVIYQAIQTSTQRPVVIKRPRQKEIGLGEMTKFRNQYAITRNLNIPGVIQFYELTQHDNQPMLIMEDFGGIPLSQYTGLQTAQQRQKTTHTGTGHRARINLHRFLTIAVQIARTLQEIHQHSIIHKDIKPDNILIHPESGRVKIIDFSLASKLPREHQKIQPPQSLEGTLAYIAPEQTGRMNRGIDYRSDFYALGATFYELLTSQLPFQANDPLELIHCHIARQPRPIRAFNSEIPEPTAALVSKLMAKNAEDRYQSAAALAYDLETFLQAWQETGTIPTLSLGENDREPQFLIPEKLYGREQAVQTLMSAFIRVAAGATELVLVKGCSGIGKTAVVKEVHKPIVVKRGYFVSGKFDQFNRNIPFSALAHAFQGLIAQILKEQKDRLIQWKKTILAAVGDRAQVIIEVIPHLKDILGPQPAVPSLSGTAAQTRFNQVFRQFIQVFTRAAHPLVVFLDDLQWADAASLQLLKILAGEPTGHLLLLGAYRDNEVFPAHPLMQTVDALAQTETVMHTLTLPPLPAATINQLTADTLRCSEALAWPLTQFIYRQAEGNPFFTTQCLKTLHGKGLITFDETVQAWEYDQEQVSQYTLTDDVVALMAQRLEQLEPTTQQVLKLAACIGNQFDLYTLSIVCEQSHTETAIALWPALEAGMILPEGMGGKLER
ncbi:MAG: AAA family ATPase [Cyanobacteria bacterium P01_F01_bin.53]